MEAFLTFHQEFETLDDMDNSYMTIGVWPRFWFVYRMEFFAWSQGRITAIFQASNSSLKTYQ